MSINRRDLLKGAAALGGASVIAGLAGCAGGGQANNTPAAEDSSAVSWAEEYDIVVVGGGGAGHIAAITAAEADPDAKVIVLEKMATAGGSTILSGGNIGAMGTDNLLAYAEENDQPMMKDDSFELYYQDKLAAGCYYSDPELARLFAFNSLDNFNWLESLGIKWSSSRFYENAASEPSNWRKSELMQASQYLTTFDDEGHGSLVNTKFRYNTGSKYKDMSGGGGNFQCLSDTLATYANATVLLDSPVKTIVREGQITGDVQGVILEDGTAIKANRAVILAAGGFSGNAEMMHMYDPRIAADTLTSGGPGNTGDMLIAASLIGGQLVNMQCIQTDFGGSVKEPSMSGSANSDPFDGAADYIDVTHEGKRFWTEKNMNEQYMDAEIMVLHKNNLRSWWRLGDSGGVSADRTPENLEVFESTYGVICDSIDALAAAIGCDAATLQETINNYNASVDAQVDNEFGKPKSYLTKKIETAPFYAFEATYYCRTTPGGLRINTDAQVLDVMGQPIPRLYACGEVTGNVHGRFRYNGGDSWTDITCFGRIAGNSAVVA